jgi:hypothetical protein
MARDEEDDGGNRKMALIGLGAVIVLFAVSLWVAHALYSAGKTQDCLMSGRTNCVAFTAPDK